MADLGYVRGSNGAGEAPRATVTMARSTGATVLNVNSVTNWPTKFIATSGVLNAETGKLNPATVSVFLGEKDGDTISIVSFAPGYSDNGHAVGDVVMVKPATAWADNLADFLGVVHDADGTFSDAGVTDMLGSGKVATNVRINARSSSQVSAATLTPNIDSYNTYTLSAQAEALTVANPTGTPAHDDVIIIRIKDNGTARAITWGTDYSNISGLDSLTTTVAGKWHTVGIMYSLPELKWQIVSISTGA